MVPEAGIEPAHACASSMLPKGVWFHSARSILTLCDLPLSKKPDISRASDLLCNALNQSYAAYATT
jgi:hypothetical protein